MIIQKKINQLNNQSKIKSAVKINIFNDAKKMGVRNMQTNEQIHE